MDGDHTIERCEEVTEWTLNAVYEALYMNRVTLEETVLKPSMVISGKDCSRQAGTDEVAERTVRVLKRCVPAAVTGIAFLSGVTIPCYLAITRIFFSRRDVVYGTLAILEVLCGQLYLAAFVARLVGAEPDEIAFVANASTGMNLVADLLAGEGPVLTDEIEFPTVTLPWIHRGVQVHFVPVVEGVLRLESFSSGSADEVVAALKEIKTAGADRLVLDLRGDPGGYVNEAVGVASQFLSSGDVYRQRDASGSTSATPVSPGGIATDIPLVVLVDGGTASSAEIVTGALQDADRATVIGEPTFGTGTVLGRFSLADGSALRIGTVEWLTPSGRRIWHEGLAPDVTVSLPGDVTPVVPADLAALGPTGLADSPDTQLRKALDVLTSRAG